MTDLAKKTVETEAVHKEDFVEKTETDDGSGEINEVDLTALAKATVETEAVHKDTDDRSVETKEVDFDGWCKGNSRNRSNFHRRFCRGNKQTQMKGLVKQRKFNRRL